MLTRLWGIQNELEDNMASYILQVNNLTQNKQILELGEKLEANSNEMKSLILKEIQNLNNKKNDNSPEKFLLNKEGKESLSCEERNLVNLIRPIKKGDEIKGPGLTSSRILDDEFHDALDEEIEIQVDSSVK